MQKYFRILVLIILTLAVIASASCGSSSNDGNGNGSGDSAEGGGNANNNPGEPGGESHEENSKPDVREILASLPDEDYGGYVFTIWTSNNYNSTLEGRQAPELNAAGEAEEIGEPVNDALYMRDRLIEEKYNITIQYNMFAEGGPLYSAARREITAGSNTFDFAMDMMMEVTKNLAQNGMAYDFNQIPNVDLDKEWWSKFAKRDLTIDGRFFFPTGDITARYPGSQYLMIFNKQIFMDEGLAYPYQDVIDGNWTLDAFFDLIKDSSKDLNGDGILNSRDDFFGLVVESMAPFCFLRAAGEGLTKIVDGNPVLNARNEKLIAITEKLASAWGNENYMYAPRNYTVYEEVPMFKEDRVMFLPMTGTNLSLFRDMESDFGIVPLPKYDSNQDEYYSHCQPWGSAAVTVPHNIENAERTGMIVEALAAAGKALVTPAAYDVTLKTKYARDEFSEIMFDIIIEGSSYDFMHLYNWGGVFDEYITSMVRGESFITKFDAREDRAQSQMEVTIEAFQNVE